MGKTAKRPRTRRFFVLETITYMVRTKAFSLFTIQWIKLKVMRFGKLFQ
ncbi:hypothetical protein FTV88_3173 [Heliorestis convoluta]|uniref:Uncharacterized protein n=1 Tax=Heliorestis convoluta TaxID=356322 RepID=A0A5Q2N360_9FIRM|nr:hypothetical protein FTV88_3173 [Heliorestis convoluta]